MKLHIGGEEEKEGWTILNAQKKSNTDLVGDIRDLSQFRDNSIEEVYASHILEHIKNLEIANVLKNLYRILSKNGKLFVSVPNLEVLSKAILDPNLNVQEKYEITRIIYGGQIDDYDYHYFGFTREILNSLLIQAGFYKVEEVKNFGLFNDTSSKTSYGFDISINTIAYKN